MDVFVPIQKKTFKLDGYIYKERRISLLIFLCQKKIDSCVCEIFGIFNQNKKCFLLP